MENYKTISRRETERLAGEIKSRFLPRRGKALIVRLSGELGSGKTAFAAGLLKSFGVKDRATSPTFVLLRRYSMKKGPFSNVFHADCYRLRNPSGLTDLGIAEILENPRNLMIVEWPELAGNIFSDYGWKIAFKHENGKNERKIKVSKR